MRVASKAGIFLFLLVLEVVFLTAGCKKKNNMQETKESSVTSKQVPNKTPKYPKEMMEAMKQMQEKSSPLPAENIHEVVHRPVVVSSEVEGKWKSVIITVVNKKTNKQKDYVVDIKKEFQIPGSKIKIKVLHFLPDFSMSEQEITSLSKELKNPAAKVVIFEGDKRVFEGWLFEKYPKVHPFQHPEYQITLKGQK